MQIVELYRREAGMLASIAQDSNDPKIRAELFDIAARFMRLAEFREHGLDHLVEDH